MVTTQEHAQASRTGEFGDAGEGHNSKQQKVTEKEELIPLTVLSRQSSDSSGNCSTTAVYSFKFSSATSLAESFHTALTSSRKEEEEEEEKEEQNGKSEDASMCEDKYAKQPMEDAHDANQTVDDPLPRPGLDLPLTRAKALESCTPHPMSSPDKETKPLNRIHRIHKRISKNISRKLTKRKEH